jgi:hypothetical protein
MRHERQDGESETAFFTAVANDKLSDVSVHRCQAAAASRTLRLPVNPHSSAVGLPVEEGASLSARAAINASRQLL